ncbi:MAG: ImmA/IrrE family metallo-endopeptidase [Nitrospira sp. SB0677_bin_15]|nr:ImmA/IrrE family metallo-endopeptidase [Nitrospira sp. SB0667_bin_9]MYD32061.1 ImmA/IrrE family metallo-endopeptidase [Nitrospira sp. SB0661_bin_20]MYG40022.1 ImmA/IrrE family metallo-endopeptidase [Nitrospira sp. SB0677_bin_15]MYH01746.1 ImmA/IrrE family metallo-endopeptidase [Nitrospira sp. SB0675_bin_23]MYJ22744.1 ImmA/IrrE family metallo-endopeptidase [Nitrospira sp. SB0673_bin_12]
MAVATHAYEPDYAVPPGWVLEEHLQSQRLSHAEFARRCGRSAKLISEIIAGKAPVEPKTALQFEKVLGLDASIWLGIEARYQLHKAREAEAKETKEPVSWAKTFPLKELVKRGVLDKPASDAEAISKLLTFFGVGSVNAWQAKYEGMSVAYRHSPCFQSDKPALATWLRLGELEAEQQECADYNETRFKQALKEIRGLTQTPVVRVLEEAQQLCNEAGVALVLLKPFPKIALSGAAWWLNPRKAVIELSVRHKTDDHLWFSLFHEAAHVLLHSKKQVFIDWMKLNKEIAEVESEANLWASNFLIPPGDWKRFVAISLYSEIAIRRFAEEQGIAPSIIVGRLQHEDCLQWQTPLNKLKVRLEWKVAS